jgi:hypothetical protein
MTFPDTPPRHVIYAILLTTSLCVSNNVPAMSGKDAESVIASLSQVQSISYQTINAYYQFSNNPGDKELQTIIEEKSAELKDRIQGLAELPGAAEMSAEIATLEAMWEDYQRLLDTNVADLLSQGYPDIRLVSELDAANLTQIGGARIAIEQARDYSGSKPDPILENIRESRLLLLSMTTLYSARSASTVSQVFQGGEGELRIDEQSARFSRNFEELQKVLGTDPKAVKVLDGIKSKWGFINTSLLNLTETNVPFVVNLYAIKIIGLLDELEALR